MAHLSNKLSAPLLTLSAFLPAAQPASAGSYIGCGADDCGPRHHRKEVPAKSWRPAYLQIGEGPRLYPWRDDKDAKAEWNHALAGRSEEI